MSWRDRAACRAASPDLFFAEGERGDVKLANDAAKAVCAVCPVKVDCWHFAVDNMIGTGVWGGYNLANSAEQWVLRKRRPPQPRRCDWCDDTFTPPHNRAARYCSRACIAAVSQARASEAHSEPARAL